LKHISLTSLSSATKIQPKYLRAIEDGNFSFLPEPYVRAFIRDYAKAIQIDPEVVIAKYEASMKKLEESVQVPQPESVESIQAPPPLKDTPRHFPEILRPLRRSLRDLVITQASERRWLPIAAILFLIAAVVLMATITSNGRKEQVSETPFEQIMKEQELASLNRSDSTAAGGSFAPLYSESDSLILEGRTSQDVWVLLVIDEDSSREYLFRPNAVRTWKAKEKFHVSLGNAGGISFRLNGKELGMLGKPGAVLQRVLITRNGVQK